MYSKKSKREMLHNLRSLLRRALKLRSEGASYAQAARVQGYADGYMRVLLDAGVADQVELLNIVGEEREARDGPAYAVVDSGTAAA